MRYFNLTIILLVLSQLSLGAKELKVELDFKEAPELKYWLVEAEKIVREWYPKLSEELASEGFSPPDTIYLRIKKSEKGVAATVRNTIYFHSSWLTKNPDDWGLVIHELVHCIQFYNGGGPWWVTEGLADYLRWAIYEKKPLKWFPKPNKDQGYKSGYRVTAGFFLWLEKTHPGTVKRINKAMRQKKFQLTMFKDIAGKQVDDLWKDYLDSQKKN